MTKIHCYHGTGELFSEFDVNRSRNKQDHYGGLLYFTDNIQVATQYAKAGAKKTGKKYIYEVDLNIDHLFDIKKTYTGKDLIKLLQGVNLEKFARNAGLLKFGVDKDEVISNLKLGNMALTGEQIFLGLSEHQTNTSRTRERLKKKGYDGLKYYGAKIFGSLPHTVYLPYNPEKVDILNIRVV